MSLLVHEIIFLVQTSIFIFVILPIGIYCCYKIWKLRYQPFFIKRYPKLTIIQVLWTCIWVTCFYPIEISRLIFPSLPYPLSDKNYKFMDLVIYIYNVLYRSTETCSQSKLK